MPSKMQFYAQMADQAAKQITGSYQNWISFLQMAGRLYKYPYNSLMQMKCKNCSKSLRQHRTILVRRLRSQNFRQIGQKPQGILGVLPRIFGQSDGI